MKETARVTRMIRLLRLLIHVSSGLIQSIVYPYFSQSIQRRMMANWAAGILTILNIRLHCIGTLPTTEIPRALLVANHVSWLDVCIMMAACPTRFVAKAEISHWPVLGFLSRNAGTLFIERARRADTLHMNQAIGEVLMRGDRVTVFPEGTTGDGTALKHFHASLLQSAIAVNALLYPVAISYRNVAGEICREAAYTDPSLVQSLQKILQQTHIDAGLSFAAPIICSEKNRRELARFSEQSIATALSLPVPQREPEKSSDLPAG